jgi:hypothetical protein
VFLVVVGSNFIVDSLSSVIDDSKENFVLLPVLN